MNQVVYQAKGAADLGAPLMQALNDAESKGVGLRVELAAGDYGNATLQLSPLDSPSKVAVEVVSTGGPAVLHGAVSVEGASVTIEGLVLDAPQIANSALSVRAAGPISLRGVAVIGAVVRDRGRDALVQLAAVGPGTTASVERLWLVGNKLESGTALLALRKIGRGSFESATVRQSVFAGNRAGSGVATTFTKTVSFEDFAVLEPSLGGPWLDVRSPITRISLARGTVATKILAEQGVDEDSKLSDFPTIATREVDLRGPSKKEHVDGAGATFGAPLKTPANWDFALQPARALATPDVAKLVSAL